MKLLNKWIQRKVKSRLHNQFTKKKKRERYTNKYYEVLHGTGLELDPSLSNEEIKVFHNPIAKQVSVTYRGTALNKPGRWKDLKSNLAILAGYEKHDRCFKEENHHFKCVLDNYRDGYQIDTTGHSLDGQLAKHVNSSHKDVYIAASHSDEDKGCWNLF